MRNEAVSREESDFARILLKSFEECSELNDYVQAARLLIFKEQQNKHRLLPENREPAAPTPASGPKQSQPSLYQEIIAATFSGHACPFV
jgi:hypothetical protein